MEYLPAHSLHELIRTHGRLDPRLVAQIGGHIANALAAGHAHGIEHRDVKPANVLIGTNGTVKLTDYGISHLTGDPHLTESGISGTPAYLAPEVAGNRESSPASDVFSQNDVLFHSVRYPDDRFAGEHQQLSVGFGDRRRDHHSSRHLMTTTGRQRSAVPGAEESSGVRRRWITGTVLAAALIAGCGTPPQAGAPPAQELPPAAEPAPAPVPAAPAAGRTVPVGAAPEGVVADSQTHIVAVGVRDPAALTLLDATTGAVLRKVPLPGVLRHLQLAAPGGPVLVPDETSNRLLRVALPGGEITSQVITGVVPHDATQAANGTVFVANELGRSVVAVRGDQIVHTFTDVTQPAGLAAVGDLVGLVDVRENTLTVYDAQQLRPVAELPAGAGPTHVVADKRGHLAVVDTRGNAVLLYELSPTPRQIGRVELPGTPYGVTYDPVRDRLWVTLTALNEVIGLNLNADTPVLATPLPTVRQPNTVAVDSSTGRLFVTGTADGVLEIIDP